MIHVFFAGGLSHQTDAPDLAGKGAKTRTDFELMVVQ